MAIASGCGFLVNTDLLPVGPAVREVARIFEIDPHLCVGAGAMIMAVKEGEEQRLINHLTAHNIDATVVGKFQHPEEGCRILEGDREKSFTFDGRDPYWEAFFRAFNQGLK